MGIRFCSGFIDDVTPFVPVESSDFAMTEGVVLSDGEDDLVMVSSVVNSPEVVSVVVDNDDRVVLSVE